MLFYWIIFILVFFCAFGKTRRDRKFGYIVSSILLGIIGCTRAMSVGMDVENYCRTYDALSVNNFSTFLEKFEPGFLASMLSLKFIGVSEPMIFIYLSFIIFWVCNLKFINKYSTYAGFCVFLIYSMGYYFESFNTVRQMLCHAIILSFIPILQENQYKKFIILTIIFSLLFHQSQIIMLLCLFPFIASEKLQSNMMLYMYLIISVLLGVFVLPKISSALAFISTYINNTTYSAYLIDTSTIGDLSLSNLAIHSAFLAFVVYFSNKYNCRSMTRNFLILAVFGQVISNLLSPVSWILARVANSLCYFRIIPVTEMFFSKYTKYKWLYRIVVLVYFVFRFYGRLMRDGVGDEGDVIPYVSIFFS